MIKKINIIILSIIFSTVITFIILIISGIKIKPFLIETARSEATKLESTIVNKAINELINNDYDTNNLFNTIKSNDGIIDTIDFNSNQVNKLLSALTMKIQSDLFSLENGVLEDLGISNGNIMNEKLNLRKGMIFEIPFGVISGNALFANMGPKFPIKLHYLNDVSSNISTKIREYGINNVLMEIYVNVEVNVKILMPFISEKIAIATSVPIAIKMIQGRIPTYYGNSMSENSSSYSLPLK